MMTVQMSGRTSRAGSAERLFFTSTLTLCRALIALVFGMLAVESVRAEAAVMVEAGNQALRDDLQWLIDRGVIELSASTWPLPLSAIEHAMEGRKKKDLTRGDVNALLNVRQFILQQRKNTYGVVARLNSDSVPQVGFAAQARAAGEVGSYLQASSNDFAGRLQVNYLADPLTGKQSRFNLEGSYVAVARWGQVLYAGQLNHWWGPGQDGSLNWGNSATAIPGLGLQRAQQTAPSSPWLSWIGPWGYDFFLGQMLHDSTVPGVKVVNMRMFARPIHGLELGASRFIQWGGDGRSNSLSSLWNAITGNSNDLGRARDPSNELSGFDIRYTFSLAGNPLTLYGQIAGEDEAGGLPSKYISLAGVQYKHMWGNTRMQWYAEGADTMAQRFWGLRDGTANVAYRHYVYLDGLYHDGLPIGHGLGGDGRLYSVGVTVAPDDFQSFSRYNVKLMYADVNPLSQAINKAFGQKGKWVGAQFAMSWVMRPVTLTAGLDVRRGHGVSNYDSVSLMFTAQIPLGGF